MIQEKLPIICEFPIENLPYTISAHKIGKDTMLIFSGKQSTSERGSDYFVISVRDTSIYIGTYG